MEVKVVLDSKCKKRDRKNKIEKTVPKQICNVR